jgi:hypothetical protein
MQRTREWCGRLRLQLVEIDRTLERLQTKPIAVSTGAQLAAETRLEELASTISARRASVEKANAAARDWVRHRRAAENEQADDWKQGRDFMMLNARADEAEDYATACLELASAAMREAAHAVIVAALARSDADIASLPAGHSA